MVNSQTASDVVGKAADISKLNEETFANIRLARHHHISEGLQAHHSTNIGLELFSLNNNWKCFIIFFSAYFLLTQRKAGLWLTYGQFPLRFSFVVFSFGFLFTLNSLFDNHSESYRIMFWILVVMEILRLVCTIQIHRKYFSSSKAAAI